MENDVRRAVSEKLCGAMQERPQRARLDHPPGVSRTDRDADRGIDRCDGQYRAVLSRCYAGAIAADWRVSRRSSDRTTYLERFAEKHFRFLSERTLPARSHERGYLEFSTARG